MPVIARYDGFADWYEARLTPMTNVAAISAATRTTSDRISLTWNQPRTD
jgi:hypothetical protein